MQCPKCKVEMRCRSRYEYSAGDPPKFFSVHDFFCRNKNCDNYDKPVSSVKTELDVSKET